MEIKIAGDSLYLTVPFLKQNQVREAERRVRDLFQSFTSRYPGMSPKLVLSMVAYELSSRYGELLRETESALQAAASVDDKLSELIRSGKRKQANHTNPDPAKEDSRNAEDIDGERETDRNDFFTSY